MLFADAFNDDLGLAGNLKSDVLRSRNNYRMRITELKFEVSALQCSTITNTNKLKLLCIALRYPNIML